MSFDFTGKTAIVTGAAHGFGRAIAKALKRLGTPDDVANGVLFFASDLAGGSPARCCRSTAESESRYRVALVGLRRGQ